MGDESWRPWSATALACGSVLLILGGLALPPTIDVPQIMEAITSSDTKWMLGAVSFFLASIGITLGLPSLLPLLEWRSWTGRAGLFCFGVGAIQFSGIAALLMLCDTMVRSGGVDVEQLTAIGTSTTLLVYLGSSLGMFYLGELLLAIALWRGRTVRRWVPAIMLLHLVMVPFNQQTPTPLQPLQEVLLGVALMALAMQANDLWVLRRARSRGALVD